jgi:hypothetical protein
MPGAMFHVKHRVPFVIPASDVSPGAGIQRPALGAYHSLPLGPGWPLRDLRDDMGHCFT